MEGNKNREKVKTQQDVLPSKGCPCPAPQGAMGIEKTVIPS